MRTTTNGMAMAGLRTMAAMAALLLAGGTACADATDSATVSVVEARFVDQVDRNVPAGDGTADPRRATYWMRLRNRGPASEVVVVWTVDGREVQRQRVLVGVSPSYRTWAARPVRGAAHVSVRVLDGSGAVLHEDRLR